MKANLFFDKTAVPDIGDLPGFYSEKEFSSPFRSTVPHLAFWKDTGSRFSVLAPLLGVQDSGELSAHFEFRVKPKEGKGLPSHTDLMLCCGHCCVAVEAKYREPPYETVTQWLAKGEDDNRRQVLQGWLDYISKVSSTITIDDVRTMTYQLLHRVASACSVKAKNRVVVYECFNLTSQMKAYYAGQLSALASLLRHDPALRLVLTNTEIRPTKGYLALQERWDKGERDLREEVCEGLSADTLMTFGLTEVVG